MKQQIIILNTPLEATFSNFGLEVHKQKLTFNTVSKKFDEIGEAVEAG